ncbi:hypothetical protein P8625_06875 [Tenacibaculum tangerinum]|uniref:Ecotin n=1 Tax=Tenacibaculum tangerinum TaxID=3038772 RepID=A0ABY8L9Q3_9FLAO|nr:hypothetical protein [Tenacibaculum tangerinum]WGH76859.1 hypothetical protein P8625_06875 [Tenacibaculum tangerinum]
MKKAILKLGKALNKLEQQEISGGKIKPVACLRNSDCDHEELFGCCMSGDCWYVLFGCELDINSLK